jgi:serine/threonine protein kinase
MALTPGTRLGPFEIASRIGEGGRGEVYRATDTKLVRDVAIRVLPELLAGGPDRFARFQREVKTLASLNHPNIAQVHGLEEPGGTKALVMELVEGPTLADRIGQGAIPVHETLAIAKQIAGALEAAHQQGIIHGDLRPANVKVRWGGSVKVLGFGLPWRLGGEAAAGASTRGEASAADPSAIDGTWPYAAPEQLRGESATARSDMWALGVMLSEMFTGARPLEGHIGFELSSALFGQFGSPDPSENPLALRKVANVRTLVERCLAKEPGARYQGAAEVLAALDAIRPGAVEASSPPWTSVLSRRSAVGPVAAVVAEGERRMARDRRASQNRRRRHLGPPGAIERRDGERRTSRDRRCG